MSDHPLVFDVNENEFETRVIEASRRTPILADFWADWCAPCRALAPVLERVVGDLNGRVRLAKVNTDENQNLAASLGIRSLPTVKLFKDSAVVDEFFGAYPEAQVRAFVDRHVAGPGDELSAKARALIASGEAAEAVALLRDAVTANPDDPRLCLDLAVAQLAHGEVDGAEETLAKLPANVQQDAEAKRLFALLHFCRLCEGAPPADELARRVDRDPADLDARLKLSARRVLEENYEAALEQLLEAIRRNKTHGAESARKSMLSVFELLGSADPRVGRYRSLMASALY